MHSSLIRENAFDLLRTYVHVHDGGEIVPIDAPESFWSDVASGAYPQLSQGRLMSAFTFSEPWATWERHPVGAELVVLLSGSVILVLDILDGERLIELTSVGSYAIVPAGIWHTARTSVETTMLFLTLGAGTEHRPA